MPRAIWAVCTMKRSMNSGGALVDFMEFVYATGSLVVGEGKGDQQEPFNLEPGEAGIASVVL